jgi:hypothetical protein
MSMPRLAAAFNSSSKSFLLLGTLPAPYVCRTTPSMGGWKKALTYNIEMNPLLYAAYILSLNIQ